MNKQAPNINDGEFKPFQRRHSYMARQVKSDDLLWRYWIDPEAQRRGPGAGSLAAVDGAWIVHDIARPVDSKWLGYVLTDEQFKARFAAVEPEPVVTKIDMVSKSNARERLKLRLQLIAAKVDRNDHHLTRWNMNVLLREVTLLESRLVETIDAAKHKASEKRAERAMQKVRQYFVRDGVDMLKPENVKAVQGANAKGDVTKPASDE